MRKGENGLIFRGTDEFTSLVYDFAVDNGLTKSDAIRLLVLQGLKSHSIIDENKFNDLWITRKNFRRGKRNAN